MRRLNQFATNLYPRWWRDRYGAEFSALLDEARPSFRGTLDILKGAIVTQLTTLTPLRIFALCSLLGIGIAAAAYEVPETVTSRAILLVPGLASPDKEVELNQRATETLAEVLSPASLPAILRYQAQMLRGQILPEPPAEVMDRMRRTLRISVVRRGVGRALAIELDHPYRPVHFNATAPSWFDPETYINPSAGNRAARMLVSSIVNQILDTRSSESRATGSPTWELIEPPFLPESRYRSDRIHAIILAPPIGILGGALLAWLYRRRLANVDSRTFAAA